MKAAYYRRIWCAVGINENSLTISLDPIRDDLIAWAESLYPPDTGAFRN